MIQYILFSLFYMLVNGGGQDSYYKITFYTGSGLTSGTSANIYVKLFGEVGNTDAIKIKSSWTDFRPRSVDSFEVNAGRDIGDIKKLIIRNDGSNIGAGWYLDKVTVQHTHSDKAVSFYINRKLKDDADDGQYLAVEVSSRQGRDSCGIASSPRIVNGKVSTKGQWPWQAQIAIPSLKRNHHCGGTLIHPQFILTAAHCVEKTPVPSKYVITLGEYDLSQEEGMEQRFRAIQIISHPYYDSKKIQNDVALIKLEKPATLNSYVKTACLPEFGVELPIGSKCYITGWGKGWAGGHISDKLKQAVMTVDAKSCDKVMSQILPILPNMLCAGKTYSSGCNGDSGGPFSCLNSSGRYAVQGAVSWGASTCPRRNAFTMFSRISEFVDWIESQIYCKYLK